MGRIGDNYGGSLEIVNHLIKKGGKKIACFAITPSFLSTIEDRVNGYKDALVKNKITPEESLIKPIHFERINEDVHSALTELLKTHPDLDSIFVLKL